jgi:hypothetical protein
MAQPGARLAALVFVLVLAGHAYFYNGTGWNQNVRLDAVYAFVEPGDDQFSFRIDRFIEDPEEGLNSGDWARAGGHYYSNKPPGSSVLAIPPYFVLYHLERALGGDPASFRTASLNAYALTLALGACLTAVASVALLALRRRFWPGRATDALAAVLVYAFATLVFPFDTQFWGHTTTAALLLLGYFFLIRAGRRSAAAAGALLGVAVAVDYLAAVSLGIAVVYLAARRAERSRILPLLAGAAPLVLALLVYQQVYFGSFLTTPFARTNPMLENDFGLPSPTAMFQLLFERHYGLFVYTPVLLLSVVGAVQLWRAGGRPLALLAGSNVLASLVAVSSLEGAYGGQTAGPRYLIASLPFWCLLLPRLSSLRLPGRAAFAVLGCVSALNMLVVTAVSPAPPGERSRLYAHQWDDFLDGRHATNHGFPVHLSTPKPEDRGHGAFSLGTLLFDMRPRRSLAVFLLLMAPLLVFTLRAARRGP